MKMQFLQRRQRQSQIVGVFVVIALLSNKLNRCEAIENNDAGKSAVDENAKRAEETTVKNILVANITPTVVENKQDIKPNAEKLSAAVTATDEHMKTVAAAEQVNKKTVSTNSQHPTANAGIQHAASSTNPESSSSSASAFLHYPEKSILNSNEEEISDSLKAGFIFFVALSLSAVSFIVFKLYRLRLSRAERKYGVQGDRSTQELTPLPTAIEDGPSDDEDETLFEVHRQNIRIL